MGPTNGCSEWNDFQVLTAPANGMSYRFHRLQWMEWVIGSIGSSEWNILNILNMTYQKSLGLVRALKSNELSQREQSTGEPREPREPRFSPKGLKLLSSPGSQCVRPSGPPGASSGWGEEFCRHSDEVKIKRDDVQGEIKPEVTFWEESFLV